VTPAAHSAAHDETTPTAPPEHTTPTPTPETWQATQLQLFVNQFQVALAAATSIEEVDDLQRRLRSDSATIRTTKLVAPGASNIPLTPLREEAVYNGSLPSEHYTPIAPHTTNQEATRDDDNDANAYKLQRTGQQRTVDTAGKGGQADESHVQATL